MNSDIRQYCFIGDIEFSKIEALHNLVVDFHERLFQEEGLQDFLFNEGYEIEERFHSYLDIMDGIWIRHNVLFSLGYAKAIMTLATEPQLVVVEREKIIIKPGEVDEWSITVPNGIKFYDVEDIQTQWMQRNDISSTVRGMIKGLQDPFDQFNLKMILTSMHKCHRYRRIIEEHQQDYSPELNAVYSGEAVTVLDNAYFNLAKRLLHGQSETYDKLAEDDFGKLFILDQKEISDMWKATMKDLNCTYES